MLDAVTKSWSMDFWRSHGVLLAVSGGVDSTALLHLMADAAKEAGVSGGLAVGHVNHALRGGESDGDADFVQNLAGELGLPFFSYRITEDDWKSDATGSREAAARNLRYDFLLRTALSLGFRYIATAHTADDQAETVLHRILRGTGLAGLAGIAPFRQLDPAVTLIRPLLDLRRRDLLAFLEARRFSFRTDSSNAGNDFTRNKIRNCLLPELRDDFNPEVDAALTRLARLAGENDLVVGELADFVLERTVRRETPTSVVFDKTLLLRFDDAVLRELLRRYWLRQGWPLRDMGFEQWADLVDFLRSGRGRKSLRDAAVAEHDGNTFIVRSQPRENA